MLFWGLLLACSGTGGSGAASDDTAPAATGTGTTSGTVSSGTGTGATTAPPCSAFNSSEQEYAPIQIVGSGLPAGADARSWSAPTTYEWLAPFSGTPGSAASHEGHDYVHDDPAAGSVDVRAASAGTVTYVRLGCPQSTEFGSNGALRECGSGWGNHVVVDHGDGVVTRYAHLKPGEVDVRVGEAVTEGQVLARMGNSGRSDVRHLHFELGRMTTALDPCAPSQSFERVYDPTGLGL